MAMAGVLGAVAIAIPYIVVPLRRSMGLPTYQWDANPESHPVSWFAQVLSRGPLLPRRQPGR